MDQKEINEFYLQQELPKDILDLNYDVFSNYVPTNYQDNYINHIKDKSIYDDGDYGNILNGTNYNTDIVEKYYEFANKNFIPVPSQKFVHNFLYNTPNRGLLLYHGLGVGKTCAAIIPSQMYILNDKYKVLRKHTIVICPASLESEWIQEIKNTCGSADIKTDKELYKHYTFIRLNGSSSTGFRKASYNIEDEYKIRRYCINHPDKIYVGDRVKIIYQNSIKIAVVIEIIDGVFNSKMYQPSEVRLKLIPDENDLQIFQTSSGVIIEHNVLGELVLPLTFNVKISNIESETIQDNTIIDISCSLERINTKNPFDNKFIIIDEAHNYTSYLYNNYTPNVDSQEKIKNQKEKEKYAKLITYENLCSAVNSKLLLLTGTPIFKDLAETPFLINMLHGYIQLYIIQFEIKDNIDNKSLISELDDNIENTLSSLEYINYFDINKRSNIRIIKFTTIQPTYIEDTYKKDGSKDKLIYYIFKKKN